ncbi:MAG: NYN domain-containing protein [Clostridia bacterium]|nr:NYN domain-containing protein [Clostridia bacterium]
MSSKDYLLVDGYNIIFAWDELKKLAKDNLEAAKSNLITQLCNYQGIHKMNLILVFDAYKVEGGIGSVTKEGDIYVVYTKEAETADQYIEKTTHELKKNYNVTVATSDGLEQVIIMSQGALRMSAKDLYIAVKANNKAISEKIHQYKPVKNNMLIDNLDSEAANFLEQLRRKR